MSGTAISSAAMSNEHVAASTHRLRVQLTGRDVDVVDDLDIELRPATIVGLVGESGSGKTTAGTALLGYARAGAQISGGDILVNGHDIRALPPAQVRNLRGTEIGYVPQDPSSALNPAIRIGAQLRELLDLHEMGTATERDERVRQILPEVGLPNDDAFLRRYPHQLSGGQVQRVALAMTFLPRPKVLVLDEPTTGLDVTTQAMVLQLLQELCQRFSVAALYVTHDLARRPGTGDVRRSGHRGRSGTRGFRRTRTSVHSRPTGGHPARARSLRAGRYPR